jgi:hypothetical protein
MWNLAPNKQAGVMEIGYREGVMNGSIVMMPWFLHKSQVIGVMQMHIQDSKLHNGSCKVNM